jgi:hypothetical protein
MLEYGISGAFFKVPEIITAFFTSSASSGKKFALSFFLIFKTYSLLGCTTALYDCHVSVFPPFSSDLGKTEIS